MQRISPFTRTPGIAGKALIDTHFSEEIIANFESTESYKYVYKIVGLRGSGKSVEYSLVMEHFRQMKDWRVYALSAGGDPLKTAIALMSREDFVDNTLRSEATAVEADIDGNLSLISGSLKSSKSVISREDERYYSDEAAFREMLTAARAHGIHILIGVDDIARTPEMVNFLSVLGAVFMEPDKDIRFICTGLSKNIEDFVNVPHLSFFVRNESITMRPLDLHSMAYKYRTLLGASREEAVELARFTKGYAYAYQVLGEICFDQERYRIDDDIEYAFDEAMGPQYDLIWGTLTEAEKELVRVMLASDSEAVADIKARMASPSSFASLRDRLMKKHILYSADRGHLSVPLPRFKEYVELWQG
jgi:uncharacterized membrane protein